MYRFFLSIGVWILGLVCFPTPGALAYSPEILANLVKPSAARVVTHTVGEARIASVVVDIKRGLIALDDRERETEPIRVDEYVSGSGMVIHPDGYIATNAHVVSQGTIKQDMAGESALAAFYKDALTLSDEEAETFLRSDEAEAFMHRVIQTVIDNSDFDLRTEVFVFSPRSDGEKMTDLVKDAFPATVESVNENFLQDDRDVAIIRVELDRLPALPIASSETLSVGSTVYVFGFPGTAELNTKSPLEATFTRGVVSAIKTATGKDFPIYQTDAKVSQGSSGGPLFNDRGEVVGLVTFQTGALDRGVGDNFAFALPAFLITQEAEKIGLSLDRHELFSAFTRGIDAMLARHCAEATEAFAETRHSNEAFPLARFVMPYVDRCHTLQANGQALDTRWERIRDEASSLSVPTLSMMGILVCIITTLFAAIWWLIRQVRHEENEIAALRLKVKMDDRRFREKEYGSERIAAHTHDSLSKKS